MNIINKSNIISNLGFSSLNKMQEDTISASKENNNVMLVAPTGSGKTVAFLMASLQNITATEGIQLLIVAPTRELVLQIESVVKQMKLAVKTNVAYGGHQFSVEKKNFTVLPTILIGTPGRVKDHIERESFDPTTIEHIIFDEFDKSLEYGFTNEVKFITKQLKNLKSKLLVSATTAIEVPKFLLFAEPTIVEVKAKNEQKLAIKKYISPNEDKLKALIDVLQTIGRKQNTIIFSNHREVCDRISEHLDDNNIIYSLFHGGLDQQQRESELARFRNGSANVLVATDIASRGIDVPELDYVIHYQLPPQESIFTHRNGRTARMKASGTSILMMTEKDYLPEYLSKEPSLFIINKKKESNDVQPDYITLHLNKGKKDKINKIDLVGFFLQFDFMEKNDVGLIEVKDFKSLVAVSRAKHQQILQAVEKKKIKKKAVKVSIMK